MTDTHEVYVATETFVTVLEGEQVIVRKRRDLVRRGHPLLELYPDKFKPAPIRFDVEQATAFPGEKRGEPKAMFKTGGMVPPPMTTYPRHVGGGFYELPDGRRIRGRDEALAAMKEE